MILCLDEQTCDATYFKCGNNRCIPGRWRCDYDSDCRDNSDELDCAPRNCSLSEFQCNSTKHCISWVFKCDGRAHCEDGSDEKNCGHTVLQQCQESDFQCSQSKYCIPGAWLCDDVLDCGDGSDELNCTSGESPSPVHECNMM